MNFSNNTLVKGKGVDLRKRGSKVHLRILKKIEISKQTVTKKGKIETQFSFKKNLFYPDHQESADFPDVFEECFFSEHILSFLNHI